MGCLHGGTEDPLNTRKILEGSDHPAHPTFSIFSLYYTGAHVTCIKLSLSLALRSS